MATTKTNLMNRMGQKRSERAIFKRELAKHIPDLWKYANTLHQNKDKSYDLLARTISKSNEMFEKSNLFEADYQILSRMMYREYLGSFDGMRIQDLYEFAAPIRAGLLVTQPASMHTNYQTRH